MLNNAIPGRGAGRSTVGLTPSLRKNPLYEGHGLSRAVSSYSDDGFTGCVRTGNFRISPAGTAECSPCMTASIPVKAFFLQRRQGIPLVVGTGSRAPLFGVHLDP